MVKTLEKTDDPYIVEIIPVDRCALPKGRYHQVGIETPQVFDIDISRIMQCASSHRAETSLGAGWHNLGRDMARLLRDINRAVDDVGGVLLPVDAGNYRKQYKTLLKKADIECPASESPKDKPKRGRVKRSKARNLLKRLMDYEDDVLRFMENPSVPFTNNRCEIDISMTKVQKKISGCFRSVEGVKYSVV